MPVISIIVPIYNAKLYLRQCIDSLLTQTIRDLEIILINDGSQDGSGAICDEYAQKDPRVRVIHQQNQGVSAARNVGINAARGEFLSFVDADDYVLPDYCEYMVALAEQHDADFISTPLCNISDDDLSLICAVPALMVVEGDDILRYFLNHEQMGYNTGKLIRTSLLKENGICYPVGVRFGEDWYFMCRVAAGTQRAVFGTDAKYQYRMEAQNNASSRYRLLYADTVKASMLLEEAISTTDTGLRLLLAQKTVSRLCHHFMVSAQTASFTDTDARQAGIEIRKRFAAVMRGKELRLKEKIQAVLIAAMPVLFRRILYRRAKRKALA